MEVTTYSPSRRIDWWPWLILAAVVLLFLLREARAQTVRIENLGGAHTAWVRTTIDRAPPHAVGRVGDVLYVVGRQVGLDTRVVDLRVALVAGQSLTVDLATATPATHTLGPLADFGGWPTIAGVPLQLLAIGADGAAWTAHFRARTGPMLCTDLWLRWYPGDGWMQGEAMVTASNPAVPDMDATVPAGFRLRFGIAVTIVPGMAVDAPIVAAGTRFADGQARAFPLVLCWPGLMRPQDWPALSAAAQLAVSAVGIEKLLADGNPTYPASFSARAWAQQRLAQSVAVLHSWAGATCGPAMASGTAGEQEDSCITRGEGLSSPPASTVIWLSALKLANRPCHHREVDGSLLTAALHPQLVLWDMRPHWHTGVSPDRLGKPTGLTVEQASGWWGADVEHAMFATLAAGARYTGSPACQQLLSTLARNYPLQWKASPPTHANAQPFAARAVGWESLLVVHLWRELEDRALAAAVRAHWQQRAELVLVPKLGAAAGDWWDVRVDDPRLGAGARVIPWQQALGAYGLDLAGAQFGVPAARTVALRAARKVLAQAWRVGGDDKWQSCPSGLRTDGTDGVFDHSFDHYGMPLAACVVLRHEPTNAQALAILAQVKASATLPKHTRWIAPGVTQ